MELLPNSTRDFASGKYWDDFFLKLKDDSFEWYGEYEELSELLNKYISLKDKLLIVGCGNSTLGPNLYNVGIQNQINIDISTVALAQMRKSYPHINYLRQDITSTEFQDGEFSCILDKGTFDALTPPGKAQEGVKEKCDLMLEEISRITKNGGRFLCVSLLQPHVAQKLLNWFGGQGWLIRVSRCPEKKSEVKRSFNFPVYMCVFTKLSLGPNIKPVYEIELTTKSHKRCANVPEILALIQEQQNFSQIKSGLKNLGFCVNGLEMKLASSDPDAKERFIIHVVDIPELLKNPVSRRYAALIVPQGREVEWLFGTHEGRIHIGKDIGYSRLVFVHLLRGQEYGTLENVQEELKGHLSFFTPQSVEDSGIKPPILAIEKAVGKREIVKEGESKFSGQFVIEDVEVDGERVRRLIFLNNASLIQSEVELKIVKKKGGEVRTPILNKLSCDHHSIMAIGFGFLQGFFKMNADDPVDAVLIGLGAGGLASFLTNFFPNLSLTAVEIDSEMEKIASQYFGMPKQNERFRVVIQDGIEFLSQSTVSKYNLILIDCDNKSVSEGLSCPPPQFLEEPFLQQLKGTLKEDQGIAVINLVCRNPVLKKEYLGRIQSVFPKVFSYSLKEEVNTILFCFGKNPKGYKKQIAATITSSLNALTESLAGANKKGKNKILPEPLFNDLDSISSNFKTLSI